MEGIQCKNGHIFSMIIDRQSTSAEWILEKAYYIAQGCEVVVDESLSFTNPENFCQKCNGLNHNFEDLVQELFDNRV